MDTLTFHKVMEDLRSSDISIRLTTFGRLSEIAQFLGAERVRTELLPYLNEFIDDEDVVILELCHQLHHIKNMVGGNSYLHSQLELLETLSCSENVTIRTKSLDVMSEVVNAMPNDHVQKYVLPVLRHLTCSEWYTARIAVCSLLPIVYQRVNSALQQELRQIFSALCVDDVPTVRRAACTEFSALVAAMVATSCAFINDLLAPLIRLTKDSQDSVRLQSVDALISFIPHISGGTHKTLPYIFTLATDRSWRVRYATTDQFATILQLVGNASGEDALAECFQKLLGDVEGEVRAVAASRVFEVASICGVDLTVRCLLKPIKSLATDSTSFCRAALAKEIMSLASVLPDTVFVQHVLPLFSVLIKDPTSDVRLNIISNLEFVLPLAGEDTMAQSLLPALCELTSNTNWRTRLAIIEHLPKLAAQLGKAFFESKLSDQSASCVGDTVSTVRDAAARNFSLLCMVFGSEWCNQSLVPRIEHLSTRRSCAYRVTSLVILRHLVTHMKLPLVAANLLPITLRLLTDSVVNIRVLAIQVIHCILARIFQLPLPVPNKSNEDVFTGKEEDQSTSSKSLKPARFTYSSAEHKHSSKNQIVDCDEPTRKADDKAYRDSAGVSQTTSGILAKLRELTQDVDRDVRYQAQFVLDAVSSAAQ